MIECLSCTYHSIALLFKQTVSNSRSALFELERHGIDAISKASGLGSVFEHVAEVGLAIGAVHLIAHHSIAFIGRFLHIGSNEGVVTWPSSSAIKLGFRIEKLGPTAHAGVNTILFIRKQVSAKGALGAMLPCYAILLRG